MPFLFEREETSGKFLLNYACLDVWKIGNLIPSVDIVDVTHLYLCMRIICGSIKNLAVCMGHIYEQPLVSIYPNVIFVYLNC